MVGSLWAPGGQPIQQWEPAFTSIELTPEHLAAVSTESQNLFKVFADAKGNQTDLSYALRYQLDSQVTQLEQKLSDCYVQRTESREQEQRMRAMVVTEVQTRVPRIQTEQNADPRCAECYPAVADESNQVRDAIRYGHNPGRAAALGDGQFRDEVRFDSNVPYMENRALDYLASRLIRARHGTGPAQDDTFDDLPEVDDGNQVSNSLSVRRQTDQHGATRTRHKIQKAKMGRRFLGTKASYL